jgi:PAS domain S-box-containing protein
MVEQHLGHALEVASEWLMVLEGKRVIYSNHGMVDTVPKDGDSIVGRSVNEVLPGRSCEGLDDLMGKIRANKGRLVTGTVECIDDIGGKTILTVRGETQGDYTYMSIQRPLVEDVSTDERLMEVEDKLSALLSLATSAGMGVGVFEITPEGELHPRSFNEHVISIFNRPQEEMVGHSPAEWIHPDDRPVLLEMVGELTKMGANSAPVQLRAIDAFGEVIHIQVANSMLSPPNDNLGISFIQDLTPMREALDQQNRMVQAVERVEDTVVLADAMGRIFYANPAALRNTGYSLEEVMGRPVSMFTIPEGAEDFADKAMTELLRRGWWRGDTMATTKDGKHYPVEVAGSAVRDERGELSMIVIISRKTQERQRFEAQLLMAKSNNERLVDHMEQHLLPGLERSIRGLGKAEVEDIAAILENMRRDLLAGKEVLEAMPPLEEAQTLRPIDLSRVLQERIPGMVARHKVGGTNISVDIAPPDEELQIMANDMLPDLIVRVVEVLMEMAEFEHPRFSITLGSRSMSDIGGSRPVTEGYGMEPMMVTVSIACPGLKLSEELKSILTRQELHTRGPLPPDQSLAVETSRLLLFIYEGRIITERVTQTEEEAVVIMLRPA